MQNAVTAMAPMTTKLRGLKKSQFSMTFSFLNRGCFAGGFCRQLNCRDDDNGNNADGQGVNDIQFDHFRFSLGLKKINIYLLQDRKLQVIIFSVKHF
jgi:hypothetical protein